MPQPHDYVAIPVTDELVTIAQWFANRRILYEYPGHDPQVFGDYGEGHVGTIVQGLIAELAVFDHLHTGLAETFGGMAPTQRNRIVTGRLSMDIIIGRYDPGHDLKIVNRTLDVKSYGTRKVDIGEIDRFNLLVNANEVANRGASDLYIQAFFTPHDQIILVGYHEGLPPLNTHFPSPAYACSVRDLKPMADLRRLITATGQ